MAFCGDHGRQPRLIAVELSICLTTSKSLSMVSIVPNGQAGQLGKPVGHYAVGNSAVEIGFDLPPV